MMVIGDHNMRADDKNMSDTDKERTKNKQEEQKNNFRQEHDMIECRNRSLIEDRSGATTTWLPFSLLLLLIKV